MNSVGLLPFVAAVCIVAAPLQAAVSEPVGVPDLLTSFGGKKIATAAEWENVRAPELRDTFCKWEYGRRPVERPAELSFEAAEPDAVMMDGKAIRKRVRISYGGKYGNGSFVATAFIPRQDKPAPAFLLICNRNPKENIDPTRKVKSGFWPAEEIVARGYAAIAFWNGDIAPDTKKAKNRKGVFACFDDPKKPRAGDAWAALSAWAWGASRVMDWIETEPLLDAKRVAVIGHSRGGKTALLAGVTDKRFTMTCSNNSGCGGAKLNHIDLPKSEHIDFMIKHLHYWFCDNYRKFRGKEMEMPFDQHQLLALIAPRLLCVGSASKDHWAGPLGEWWSAKLASQAWELYGKKGLVADAFPKPDTSQQEGCVSYHIRTGKHNLTPYDWNRYMDFADRHGWRSGR